jgi:hypothetical protein
VDAGNDNVGIGTGAPSAGYKLHVAGKIHAGGNIKTDGNYISSDGNNAGIYIDNSNHVGIGTGSPYAGNYLHVNGATRVTSSSQNVDIGGTSVGFSASGAVSTPSGYSLELQSGTGAKLILNSSSGFTFNNTMILSSGSFRPNTAGSQDLGTSSYYWGEINYKVLTDRGCIVTVDDQKALDALKKIRVHRSKKSKAGKRLLAYKTFPKCIYRHAVDEKDKKGKIIAKGEEGVDVSGIVSLLIAANKELVARLEKLEKAVAVPKKK